MSSWNSSRPHKKQRSAPVPPSKTSIECHSYTSITVNDLIAHIEHSFDYAEKGISNITNEILAMEGMSGTKTRHFYNNLLNKDEARYLEIGTWKGSSVCSAMYKNHATVVCIDNWSEFNGPKREF